MTSRSESLSTKADPATVSALLKRDGLVLLEGVHGRAHVIDLARRMVTPWQHRDAESDGVTVISDRGAHAERPGFAGFGTGGLSPHTESSALAIPPRMLLLVCGAPAARGGESVIVDGAAVYADLLAEDPVVIDRLRQPRSVRFAPGRWGSVFTTTADGCVSLRLRLDDLAYFTEPVQAVLPKLIDAIRRHQRILPLKTGEGYLLDNRRMLHGRNSFTGQSARVMFRVLGDPTDAITLPTGFMPRGTTLPVGV
ncbi:TauD/TfdA family dioxygenase [Nonomuraea sp. NPDC049784]|uniref:TauD/TfdA family dioxygenase n=1 Tax=Nonomuraea sp. NPDC049784 TaxID=3154361 RepID=UPI0033C57A07